MEITFNDVKNILIGILLVECHCVLFYTWVSECPKYRYYFRQFPFGMHAKKEFVAAIILQHSVCSDP